MFALADVVSSLAIAASSGRLNPHLVTTFPVKHAAVSAVAEYYPGSAGPALLLTTFAPFGPEPTYVVPNLRSVSTGGTKATVETIEDSTTWTNYIGIAPKEIGTAVVATAGGFLVPGHGTGTINLFDVSDPNSPVGTQVSTDKKNWFYHKIVWYDVDGDGLLDIVAARATAPKPTGGELIWLKQPSHNASSIHAWAETVITQGPDVDFIIADIDGEGLPEVVAAEFFSSANLVSYKCSAKLWSECTNGMGVTSTIIDSRSGPFFAVRATDLNRDGAVDLLATNNEDDATGSVFSYTKNKGATTWTRHTLATGFSPFPSSIPSPGAHSRGSPGAALPFHIMNETSTAEKPLILVSGDDGGFFAILRPVSEAISAWDYTTEFVVNSSGTVGGPSVFDVDSDGQNELILPFYADGKVQIYNFTATSPPPVNPQCRTCLLRQDPLHLSPAYSWCFQDDTCHKVGSTANPCSADRCASAAIASKCKCSACNDESCV